MKKEKKEFLRHLDKELGKGNIEYKRYVFRLTLIGGTKKEKQQAIDEFENQMCKVEIRKGNADCRIEHFTKVMETLKPKPHMSGKEMAEFAERMDTISEKTEFDLIFTRSGTPFLDE